MNEHAAILIPIIFGIFTAVVSAITYSIGVKHGGEDGYEKGYSEGRKEIPRIESPVLIQTRYAEPIKLTAELSVAFTDIEMIGENRVLAMVHEELKRLIADRAWDYSTVLSCDDIQTMSKRFRVELMVVRRPQ